MTIYGKDGDLLFISLLAGINTKIIGTSNFELQKSYRMSPYIFVEGCDKNHSEILKTFVHFV